jgi:hypothetical protein
MVGVEQETKVTSSRRGEDWGGGMREGLEILESWISKAVRTHVRAFSSELVTLYLNAECCTSHYSIDQPYAGDAPQDYGGGGAPILCLRRQRRELFHGGGDAARPA